MLAIVFLSALPNCDGKLLDAFERKAIEAAPKNSEKYIAPDEATRRAVGEGLTSALDQLAKKKPDYVFALERAALAGYELCAEEELVLLRPVKAGFGQPVLAIRRGHARGLIIEVPHTVTDYGTLDQGVAVFTALKARALIVAGAHRCASSTASACDGATAVCGSSGAFRTSDMAHATDTIFQLAHRVLAAQFRSDIVLSLHGMEGRGAVVSDGTMIATSSTAPVARFARMLEELLPKERVRQCNAPHADAPDDLCGTTNVQGRSINGVEDACHEKAMRSSGRFLHLEQSARVRKHPETLVRALDRVLPPAPTSPDETHLENLESLR